MFIIILILCLSGCVEAGPFVDIIDCGVTYEGFYDFDKELSNKAINCFRDNLKKCNSAKVILNEHNVDEIEYKILKEKNGLCYINVKLLKFHEQEFINKEMLCKIPVQESSSFITNPHFDKCEGDLVDLMK